ncbi:hypothetical protein F9K33_10460 [bacterium]|nr:MAG: hypothetical protein F9K33_10460 [bacterium]
MISKSIQQLFYSSVLFIILITPSEVLGQSDSLYRESFPDDLFLEQDKIDMLKTPGFVIPNKKIHIIMGYSQEFSATKSQFEKRFGTSSSGLTTLSGVFVGAEFQISPRLTTYAHFVLPQKLNSKLVSPYVSLSFETKHELSYGTIFRLGTIFDLKRYSHWDVSAGIGTDIQNTSMKSTLLSNKNAIPNSVLIITNKNQSSISFGVFGTACADYYVSNAISIQAKLQLNLRPVPTKIKEQQLIRRANLYFGSYDYIVNTFSTFNTGGAAMVFELGARWHLSN